MPTIQLGRVLPVDQGTWIADTKYVKQDIVDYDNKSYFCVKSHMSSSSITPTNRTYWIAITGEGSGSSNNSYGYDKVKHITCPSLEGVGFLNININDGDYFKIELTEPMAATIFSSEDIDISSLSEEEFNSLVEGHLYSGTIHPAPEITTDGNHLKTIMLDIQTMPFADGSGTPEILFMMWPTYISWANGTPPEPSGTRCVYLFVSYDGGYTWVGMESAKNVLPGTGIII